MLPAIEIVYPALEALCYPPLRFGMQWSLEGLTRIPEHGPVLVASNHISYLDPFTFGVAALIRRRRVRFLAKQELFQRRELKWILRNTRQIPVARGTASASGSLVHAADALRAGELVCVYPEGTISTDLDPMAGRTGTARLAQLCGVPVVPVGLWGSHRMLTKRRKPHLELGIAQTVVAGPPVTIAPDDDMYDATDRIMRAVCAAVARARAIYPQREPGAWWDRDPQDAVLQPCRREAS
ncbi:MAG: lysophospholipid acyltransferase family protein [Acidimicrobiia bacterium]